MFFLSAIETPNRAIFKPWRLDLWAVRSGLAGERWFLPPNLKAESQLLKAAGLLELKTHSYVSPWRPRLNLEGAARAPHNSRLIGVTLRTSPTPPSGDWLQFIASRHHWPVCAQTALAQDQSDGRPSSIFFKALFQTIGTLLPDLHPFLLPSGFIPCSFHCTVCATYTAEHHAAIQAPGEHQKLAALKTRLTQSEFTVWSWPHMLADTLLRTPEGNRSEEHWASLFPLRTTSQQPVPRQAFPAASRTLLWHATPPERILIKPALLEISQTHQDFFAPESLAMVAGWLRNMGFDPLRIPLQISGDEDTQRLLDGLQQLGVTHAVFHDVLHPPLFQSLTQAGVTTILAGGRPAKTGNGLSYTRTGGHALGLIDLIEALSLGQSPPPEQHLPEYPLGSKFFHEWFDPLLYQTALPDVPLQAVQESRRYNILHAPFCSYARNFSQSPFFRGVDFPKDVNSTGCTFCGIKQFPGDLFKPKELAALQAHQIRTVAETVPVRNFVFYPPIAQLAGIIEFLAGLPPLTLWLHFRVNEFLKTGKALTQALQAARRTGHRIHNHLIGFENFSDTELARFNKGIRATDIEAAMDQLAALHQEFPDVFDYRSQSHGFILFTPWTTLEDLEANAAFALSHDVSWMRAGMATSALRLARHIPLYFKALQDGLITGPTPPPEDIVYGYAGDYFEWRFQDEHAALVYSLMKALAPIASGRIPWQFQLLARATRFARELKPPLPSKEAFIQAFSKDHADFLGASSAPPDLPQEIMPMAGYVKTHLSKIFRYRLSGLSQSSTGIHFTFEHERPVNRRGAATFTVALQPMGVSPPGGFQSFATTAHYRLSTPMDTAINQDERLVLDTLLRAVTLQENLAKKRLLADPDT